MRKKDFYNNDLEVSVNEVFNPYSLNEVVADPEQQKFNSLVFAPDPETGNPNSDVYYLLHGNDEGLKSFIKEKLFNSSGSASLAEDADVALDMVKPNLMTQSQYLEHCKEYVSKMLHSKEESED